MSADTPRILLVDDDASLAQMLREFLQLQGFAVEIAFDAQAALAEVDRAPPDLIVLDVMLPGIDGLEALRRLRQHRDIPVIMLTARGEASERIQGLTGGADDYLAKPCSPLELAVRIRTVLKRARGLTSVATLTVGPLELDLKRREVRAQGRPLILTAAEMRVLEQLMRRPGEVLSRAQLTQLALDRQIEAYDRSVDTLISRLRRKLEGAGMSSRCIAGLRGHGYVLDVARTHPA